MCFKVKIYVRIYSDNENIKKEIVYFWICFQSYKKFDHVSFHTVENELRTLSSDQILTTVIIRIGTGHSPPESKYSTQIDLIYCSRVTHIQNEKR
jgi:hypothetical protein